ncbi:MAG: ATP-binding protein [Crocinitomicaceae bacterium]
MDKIQLQALISQGEGLHLEFKEAINSSLSKEIVAFANTKGGKVLIGVDDDGNIKSKTLGNDDKSKIQNIARDCDPSLDVEIETVDNEPHVLVVNVKSGANKPYRCTSGFYIREGASSNKRTTDEIRGMFEDAERFAFDDKLCPKADFDTYFEAKSLSRFFAESKKEQVLSDVDSLHNIGVLEFVDEKPVFNNTGVLFFTKDPTRFLSQSLIQCARYKGTEKIDIEDQKDLDSDVFTNIDEAFTFLRRSLDVAFKFESGKPTRTEVWEIPYQALKEALVNAIAHRDYVKRGTHIQVEVFDDRVSFTNFGGLLSGMTPDDLGKRSAHRNPNIVNILHRTDYIEKMGTGILRINNELKEAGLPKAEFDINDHWFTIIFKRKKVSRIKSEVKEKLSKNEKAILSFCADEPKSRVDIFEELGISNETRNFNRHLMPLIESSLVSMTIPDKPRSRNQKYYTTDLGLEALSNH